jgi:hypothetical protein
VKAGTRVVLLIAARRVQQTATKGASSRWKLDLSGLDIIGHGRDV